MPARHPTSELLHPLHSPPRTNQAAPTLQLLVLELTLQLLRLSDLAHGFVEVVLVDGVAVVADGEEAAGVFVSMYVL